MRKIICILAVMALLCAWTCTGEAPRWTPRIVPVPQNEMQQAVYDLALERAEEMKRIIASAGSFLENTQELGLVSDELLAYLQDAENTFGKIRSVAVMLPTEAFPRDIAVPDELWPVLGMRVGHYANSYNGSLYQVEFLDDLAVYSAHDLSGGSGMAYALCTYGKGRPQIGISVQMNPSGAAVCRTGLVYFDQIDEVPQAFLAQAITLFGDNAFETVIVK